MNPYAGARSFNLFSNGLINPVLISSDGFGNRHARHRRQWLKVSTCILQSIITVVIACVVVGDGAVIISSANIPQIMKYYILRGARKYLICRFEYYYYYYYYYYFVERDSFDFGFVSSCLLLVLMEPLRPRLKVVREVGGGGERGILCIDSLGIRFAWRSLYEWLCPPRGQKLMQQWPQSSGIGPCVCPSAPDWIPQPKGRFRTHFPQLMSAYPSADGSQSEMNNR